MSSFLQRRAGMKAEANLLRHSHSFSSPFLCYLVPGRLLLQRFEWLPSGCFH